MTHKNHKLTDQPQSFWLNSVQLATFPELKEDIHVDVTIIGGGITGIRTAYLLANEGLRIALLDSDRLLHGTTGHTTAKVTAQHDMIYDELISTIGKEQAALYYQANQEAVTAMKQTINEHQISCDFQVEDAFIYATTEEYEQKILHEAAAYEKLNINGSLIEKIPLDLEIKNALKMNEQAQFHPTKYLQALIDQLEAKNVQIFENTTAVNIESGASQRVITRDGPTVTSDYVAICSHFPFFEGKGLYSTRMYADRSYALVAKTKKNFPGGMYLSAEKPAHSLRKIQIDQEEFVLFVGESHKTGKDKDTTARYQALQLFGDETLGIETTHYHWSAQDLISLDKLPYIGPLTASDSPILVATGFRKWGMTQSHVAAKLFVDHILERENKYTDIYTPSRFNPMVSIPSFAKTNVDTATQLLKGKLEKPTAESTELEKDEGKVITVNGERKGAYRDTTGELHIVDTTCTHIGCEVNWNNAERSWDCPCHGSRFTYTGEVIEGPAEKPLKKYDYKMIENFISDESGY